MEQKGAVAIVTGASRGIGKAIAVRLAQAGCTVVGTATSAAGAQRISDYLAELGVQGSGQVLNVADLASIDACVKETTQRHGVPLVLVNNAAITEDNLFIRMKPEQWSQVIETNLSSIFHMTQRCLKGMIKQRWGRVVSIGSVVGHSGNPGQVNYCAAKAGVVGATKSMALEYAKRGLTFNVVAPGFIATDMTEQLTDEQQQQIMQQIPAGRMGTPEDVAHAVQFLVSPAANYITGQTIHVNGGMLMN